MNHQNMILLQCPLCKGYYVAEVKAVRVTETVLCPHCHKESEVNEVLNRKINNVKADKFLYEIKQFAENISLTNVNELIGRICGKYHISPIVTAYIVNCLLDSHPVEDYPPLFVEYKSSHTINLNSYLDQLEKIVAQDRQGEPKISLSDHFPDALEIAYQRKIKELEQKIINLQNQHDDLNNLIDNINHQLDAKQNEVKRLKDKIIFLQLKP